jgi:hypothetical protein
LLFVFNQSIAEFIEFLYIIKNIDIMQIICIMVFTFEQWMRTNGITDYSN